jgi:hypothetical protein
MTNRHGTQPGSPQWIAANIRASVPPVRGRCVSSDPVRIVGLDEDELETLMDCWAESRLQSSNDPASVVNWLISLLS